MAMDYELEGVRYTDKSTEEKFERSSNSTAM